SNLFKIKKNRSKNCSNSQKLLDCWHIQGRWAISLIVEAGKDCVISHFFFGIFLRLDTCFGPLIDLSFLGLDNC
uniref:Ovule protein n=1 Tax=Romanomermis culicivorax TaxID=13658 RepID=A0A915HUJ1_ROMCU